MSTEYQPHDDDIVERELIESLGEKLEAFAANLDDRERDLLAATLRTKEDAMAGEVSGFAFGSKTAQSIGRFSGKNIPSGISMELFPKVKYTGETRLKISPDD